MTDTAPTPDTAPPAGEPPDPMEAQARYAEYERQVIDEGLEPLSFEEWAADLAAADALDAAETMLDTPPVEQPPVEQPPVEQPPVEQPPRVSAEDQTLGVSAEAIQAWRDGALAGWQQDTRILLDQAVAWCDGAKARVRRLEADKRAGLDYPEHGAVESVNSRAAKASLVAAQSAVDVLSAAVRGYDAVAPQIREALNLG